MARLSLVERRTDGVSSGRSGPCFEETASAGFVDTQQVAYTLVLVTAGANGFAAAVWRPSGHNSAARRFLWRLGHA